MTGQKLSEIIVHFRSAKARMELVMFSAMILVAGASTGIYFLTSSTQASPGQIQLPLRAGTSINITSLDRQMIGGTFHTEKYLGEIIHFSLSRDGTLLGNWHSTGKSVMYVTGLNWVWMELPWPGYYNGSFNQTLPPGQYELIYGGYAGDVITIDNTIAVSYNTPHSISSLVIPAGAVLHTQDSSALCSFNIKQAGTIVGSFWTTGSFTISISTTSHGNGSIEEVCSGFSFGDATSTAGTTNSGLLTTPLESGSYAITFHGSVRLP